MAGKHNTSPNEIDALPTVDGKGDIKLRGFQSKLVQFLP
jgi:hypothetical protein